LSAATAAGARAIAVIADRGGMLDRHDCIVDFTGLSLDAEAGCLRFQRAV
jgi:hypothetical protein